VKKKYTHSRKNPLRGPKLQKSRKMGAKHRPLTNHKKKTGKKTNQILYRTGELTKKKVERGERGTNVNWDGDPGENCLRLEPMGKR